VGVGDGWEGLKDHVQWGALVLVVLVGPAGSVKSEQVGQVKRSLLQISIT
jgi:hypothetical protein